MIWRKKLKVGDMVLVTDKDNVMYGYLMVVDAIQPRGQLIWLTRFDKGPGRTLAGIWNIRRCKSHDVAGVLAQ